MLNLVVLCPLLLGPVRKPTGEQVVMHYDMLHVTPPQGEHVTVMLC
jgi:hypothetical protein